MNVNLDAKYELYILSLIHILVRQVKDAVGIGLPVLGKGLPILLDDGSLFRAAGETIVHGPMGGDGGVVLVHGEPGHRFMIVIDGQLVGGVWEVGDGSAAAPLEWLVEGGWVVRQDLFRVLPGHA